MRVVLDTNTLVSALLFAGIASGLVPLWQSRRITALVSKSILKEYLRVLGYPKFGLSEGEIRGLIEEELLPYVEVIAVRGRLPAVCRDPEDMKFLEYAVAGRAEYLITGDQDLRSLGSYRGVTILTSGEILQQTEH
jgi:putative PIN family toxin of toxin-antitoxin system